MSTQHRVELARTLCASGTPINKSQLAKLLGIARSSLYVQPQRPHLDKALAVRIETLQELDDTLGHRKLAVLLKTGKNRETPPRHPFHRAALTLAEKLANWTFPMIG